jgi:hypothetical protein
MNNNPYLQYRHCEGLGDIVACTLHSRLLSPITKIVTGKSEMCLSCDSRRRYLNFVFPISIWKLFFKNYDEKTQDLQKYFVVNDDEIEIIEDDVHESTQNLNDILTGNVVFTDSKEGYLIINNSEIEIENFVYKTIIYKKI